MEIKETTDDQYHSSFLGLLLEIDKDSGLRVKIYDKRDDFNFDILNFPFLCGNIPQSPSNGVYIYQLIRYARASTLYDYCLSRSYSLTSKLMRQGYELCVRVYVNVRVCVCVLMWKTIINCCIFYRI